MIDWITTHWQTISITTIGTALLALIGWWGKNHGWIFKVGGWFRSKSQMGAEIADLKTQVSVAKTEAAKLQAERDQLAKKFEPTGLQPAEIEIIGFLAVRGRGITGPGLATRAGLSRTRFDYHIDRLERTFEFVIRHDCADTAPSTWHLTEFGKAYAVKHDLDKAQQDMGGNAIERR